MSFDIDSFVNTAVDPLSTVVEQVPEGDWKMSIDSDPAQLQKADDPKAMVGIKNIKGVSEKGPYDFWTLELRCIVVDEKVKQKLNRESVQLRMRINLDFNESGQLDASPGKNVKLGQLREALGQNGAGWNPKQLLGAGPFIGRVKHTPNKNDPEQKYAEVVRAVKLS